MTTTMTSAEPKTAMSDIWDTLRIILQALALALLLRFTVAQPFRIPSGSMQPTLAIGDYVVVTKWSYGYGRYSFAPLEGLLPRGRVFASQPERGDVIVFRPPLEPYKDYIKRLIGLPGDRIQMRDGVLHINGEPVAREQVGVTTECGVDEAILYRETLPNGVNYLTCDINPTKIDLDETREFQIPNGHYFMMGDNRDNSDDSRRSVGFVPYDNLVGPAQFTVVSFTEDTSILRPWTLFTGFRTDRFMRGVE
jgi:signal peptidase I